MHIIVSATISGGILARFAARLDRLSKRIRGAHSERGDVPGWVMITLMSAVLVMGLLAIAGPALEGLFQQAISKVSK